jgi:hypothetical protein
MGIIKKYKVKYMNHTIDTYSTSITYKYNSYGSNKLYIVLYFKKLFEKLDFFILKSLIRNYYSKNSMISSRELLEDLVLELELFLDLKISEIDYKYSNFDLTINKLKKYKTYILNYWYPKDTILDYYQKFVNIIVKSLLIYNELLSIFDEYSDDMILKPNIMSKYSKILDKGIDIEFVPFAGNKNIKSFFCSKNVITIYQYLKFVKKDGYNKKQYWSNQGYNYIKQNQIKCPKNWYLIDDMWYIGKSPAVFLFNYPIFNISYYEAEAFANFSNARLPTEEEWDWIASNRNKTSTPYGTCLPNVYSIICDINEKELINFTSSESLMKVNMLYGNVWEFLRSDNDRIVHCKGGDNVTPNFIMNNDLIFQIPKESRLYSVGIRLIY